MPKKDIVSNRINAIARLLGAIAAILGLFIGVPKVQEILKEGDVEVHRAPERETDSIPIIQPSQPEPPVTENNVSPNSDFELIRKGFQLKETRFITFDDEKFRLSFLDINSVRESAVAVISDNNGDEIIDRHTLAKGDFFDFEIGSALYRVHLYGMKKRIIRSNLAFFDIYKSK